MTTPLWCLFAGILLPYIWAASSLPFRLKQFGTFDFAKPREQADKLVDAGHGALGAQLNAWEALSVFAAANLIAFMAGVDPAGNWSLAAIIWLVSRVFHGVFYITNLPPLRTICFAGGLFSSLYIIILAITS
jgi:uncharacterized MAPEG superfamily protein